jgi:hypothetical protein
LNADVRWAIGGRWTLRRTVCNVVLTVVGFVVVTPLSVLAAAKLGPPPTHWSGTPLRLEIPFDDLDGPPAGATEEMNLLLSQSNDQDQGDTGDLAPSWYDPGTRRVVLGAVTARGEEMRRALATGYPATRWRVERVRNSAHVLEAIGNEAVSLSEYGIFMTVVDAEHNRVQVTTTRLSHALFVTITERFGDTVQLRFAPLSGPGYLGEPPPNPPSLWERTRPPATWWTLATGFPWHLGVITLGVVTLWAYPLLRRRPQPAPARTGPTEPTTPVDLG